ncbi:hypothetical protein Tco_0299117 [Tanacetum coccineum]
MFDEYFNPPPSANSLVQVATSPRAVDLDDSPVSTSIDQDAPSTSILSTKEQEQSPILSQGVKESLKTPYFHDDPLHEDSTSQGSSSNVDTPFKLLGKWTKNHPIENVIGDPSCSMPEDASPTSQSPDYVPEFDPEADPVEDDVEDPEEDPVDYPADRGDDDDDEEGS